MGGRSFFSNGIHLNVIEAARDSAAESWANIHAINDLVRDIIETPSRLVIAAGTVALLASSCGDGGGGGQAGAGGSAAGASGGAAAGAGGSGAPPGPSTKVSGETAACWPTPGRLQSHTPPGKVAASRANCVDEKTTGA